MLPISLGNSGLVSCSMNRPGCISVNQNHHNLIVTGSGGNMRHNAGRWDAMRGCRAFGKSFSHSSRSASRSNSLLPGGEGESEGALLWPRYNWILTTSCILAYSFSQNFSVITDHSENVEKDSFFSVFLYRLNEQNLDSPNILWNQHIWLIKFISGKGWQCVTVLSGE